MLVQQVPNKMRGQSGGVAKVKIDFKKEEEEVCVVTVTVHYARKMRWSSGQCNKRKNGQGKDPRT